jgi:hypothetical protein
MLWVLCRGAGLAVQRLDAHALHQRRHMLAPDLEALLGQQIAQHARARKRHFQMQTIDALHQLEISFRNRPRQGVHRGTGNPQSLGLTPNR